MYEYLVLQFKRFSFFKNKETQQQQNRSKLYDLYIDRKEKTS